jgi:hypothetical protein
MNYYRMDRQMPGNGAIIFRRSHKLIPFKTGAQFGDGFEEPLITELDKELHNGVLPTFFTSPGFIVKIDFYNDLKKIGIDNFEVYKTIIKNPIDGRIIENYLFLNIIGRVSCANMDKSEYETIDEDMNVVKKNPSPSKFVDLSETAFPC